MFAEPDFCCPGIQGRFVASFDPKVVVAPADSLGMSSRFDLGLCDGAGRSRHSTDRFLMPLNSPYEIAYGNWTSMVVTAA